MLKDEPDDLTHLAPVPGDVCVPLDDHPFLSDVLDDILLKDNNFAPLLAEEPSDPFISYRDHDPSPQLLSPNLSKVSQLYDKKSKRLLLERCIRGWGMIL